MKDLYSFCMLSKQAFYKYLHRGSQSSLVRDQVVLQASAIRKVHPGLGCRAIYELLDAPPYGRDKIESILLNNGFRLTHRRNYIKTTIASKHLKYPNLIEGLVVERINQVWQSDLTYFILSKDLVWYIVFIIDIYSRRILGYTASDHMRAQANVACLEMAKRTRLNFKEEELIHHSDFGSQYGSDEYLKALGKIRISMSKYAWKNAYAERINGTIKNQYLSYRTIRCFSDLLYHLKRDVESYNNERPHTNLPKRMSPVAFEKYLGTIPKEDHPTFTIYKEIEPKRSGLSPTISIMETLFRFP